jgi:transposase
VQEEFNLPRDPAGIEALVQRVQDLAPAWVGLEATGGLEQVVAAALAAARLPLVVANPARVRALAKALGLQAKTDRIDARLIARFLLATRPALRALPDEATQQLGELVARRRQIVEMIVAERQRLRAFTEKRPRRSAERVLAALQEELTDLDTGLDETIRATPLWQQKEELMTSVPGVGPIIARTMLAELPEMGSLDRRQVAAIAGLAPWTRQSGRWKGRSFIGGGRSTLRAVLYMGAVVAARHNPLLRTFYQRLLAAGKPRLVALVAVARKLLTILNAIVRSGRGWDDGQQEAAAS